MVRILIRGDCLEEMKNIPDQSVDLTITSPPYNMNLRIRNGKYCSRQITKELTTKYENFSDNMTMDELFYFNCLVLDELLRVSKITFYNIQFLTGNKSAFFRLIGKYHDKIKEVIVWDKVNAQPSISERTLNSRFEVLLVFENEGAISRRFKCAKFNKGTIENLWQIKRGKKINKTHGAVFPVELSNKIISMFSSKGEVILDPFMGTGTTGVSCKLLHRKFIGIEKDEGYFEIAKKRIEEA